MTRARERNVLSALRRRNRPEARPARKNRKTRRGSICRDQLRGACRNRWQNERRDFQRWRESLPNTKRKGTSGRNGIFPIIPDMKKASEEAFSMIQRFSRFHFSTPSGVRLMTRSISYSEFPQQVHLICLSTICGHELPLLRAAEYSLLSIPSPILGLME